MSAARSWPSDLGDTTPLLERASFRSSTASFKMTASHARTAFLGVDVGTGSARAEIEESSKKDYPNNSAKCSLTWWFDKVKKGLEMHDTRLNLFRQSQFSFLLDIPSFRYIGAITHCLLLRHKCEVGKLVFQVRGKLLKFTEMDFALITGLKIGDLYTPEKVTSEKSIREEYLKQYPIIKKHLGEAFDKIVGTNKHEDVVKVALLMCVEWFVRGTDTKYQCKSEFIELVNSLEEFNKYPWGSLAFQTMTQGVLTAAKASRSGGKTYNVYGCIFPMQIWAIERVPTLRKILVSFVPSQIPRFIQYRGWKGWRYPTINDVFDSEDTNVILALEPTSEELETEAVRLVRERFQGIEAGFIERSREVRKKRALDMEDEEDEDGEEDEEDEDDEEDEEDEKEMIELREELKEVQEGFKKAIEELKKVRKELKFERKELKKERELLKKEREDLKKEREKDREEFKKEREKVGEELKIEREELKKKREELKEMEGEKETKMLEEGLDKVYVSVNYNNRHWILMVIHPQEREIIILESLKTKVTTKYKKEIKIMTEGLPIIFHATVDTAALDGNDLTVPRRDFCTKADEQF